MRLLIAATLLLFPIGSSSAQHRPPASPVPFSATTPGTPSGDRICERAPVRHAEAMGPLRASRLGDLPPGDLHLALLREVDGCPEPVIVGYNFGQQDADPPASKRVPVTRQK
jgi:hypothetical protein